MKIDSDWKRELTLISEEDGATIVGSKEDDFVFLRPDVHDRSLSETASQILSLDREKPVGSQVSEIQHRRTAALLHQRRVEYVSALNTGSDGVRKDHSISFLRDDIVNDNRSWGGVGHVHIHLAIVRVVDRQILQTRRRVHQVTQIDHLHDLWHTISQRESFISGRCNITSNIHEV